MERAITGVSETPADGTAGRGPARRVVIVGGLAAFLLMAAAVVWLMPPNMDEMLPFHVLACRTHPASVLNSLREPCDGSYLLHGPFGLTVQRAYGYVGGLSSFLYAPFHAAAPGLVTQYLVGLGWLGLFAALLSALALADAERLQHVGEAVGEKRQLAIADVAGSVGAEEAEGDVIAPRAPGMALDGFVRNVQPAARQAGQLGAHGVPGKGRARRGVVRQVRRQALVGCGLADDRRTVHRAPPMMKGFCGAPRQADFDLNQVTRKFLNCQGSSRSTSSSNSQPRSASGVQSL